MNKAISPENISRIHACLLDVYGETTANNILPAIVKSINLAAERIAALPEPAPVDQNDTIIITYADQFRRSGQPPLETLDEVASIILEEAVSSIHLLPFYPFTSDDGFSVSDYRRVNPDYGDWCDITRLGKKYRLMFDGVINHTSVQHPWFQKFLASEQPYDEYYVTAHPDEDLSMVVRPRALPLLTPFETAQGMRHVWTTFSADQVDLNYANPKVLLEIVDLLLFYVGYGAQFIRLDAIAYLWKKAGTPCIHLPQTHSIIKLFRAVLDATAPYVYIITETNVPHQENISYFGDGSNEAHMVYNFALPPLVLHAVQTGNTRYLTNWASQLTLPSAEVAFFNFLASHDGIGLNPVRGILPENQINQLVRLVNKLGGHIGQKKNPDGSLSPYELNINYFDAVGDPDNIISQETHIARFMLTQSVLLTMAGIPGIYIHSLIGSRGWSQGVELTGRNRAINRQKLDADTILKELQDVNARRHKIWSHFRHLLQIRKMHSAFHPFSPQEILPLDDRIFAILRYPKKENTNILCLHNFSPSEVLVPLPAGNWKDLLQSDQSEVNSAVTLKPYDFQWLKHTG